jgi:hypothetical protein
VSGLGLTEQEYIDTVREIRKDAQHRLARLLAQSTELATERVDGWGALEVERAIQDTRETLDLTAWVEGV